MKPVLIGGCPRSGTTLLGILLGAHPECCPVPEAQFKVEALRGTERNPEPTELWRSLLARVRTHRFYAWKHALERVDPHFVDGGGSYREMLEHLVSAYTVSVHKGGVKFWIDDTPTNKNFLPTLLETFPEAKALHIVRDGRAVANSVIARDWGPNTVLTAAYWWLVHLSHGLAAEAALPPARIRRVRYEDLVREPESTLTGICDWLHIDYSPRMIDPRFYTVDARSARFNAMTTRAPDGSRAEGWRQSLSPREIEVFEAETKEMLSLLGYPMEHGARARRPTLAEKAVFGLSESWRGTRNSVAFKVRRTYRSLRE